MKNLLLLLGAYVLPAGLVAQQYARYAVLIHELFPDPTPPVGLPLAEFVELRNSSSQTINLRSWKLTDGTSTATIASDVLLAPDSLIILCALAAQAQWAPYGRTVGVANFPSLNNDGDLLILRAPDNRVIHAVQYAQKWYANTVKSQGGWSLEMIDPSLPCQGSKNWSASTSPVGGTPGKENAVHGKQTDARPPFPIRSTTDGAYTLLIELNEPVDSLSGTDSTHSFLEPAVPIARREVLAPLFQTIRITLQAPLKKDSIYSGIVSGLQDCAGNTMQSTMRIPIGLPSPVQPGDLLLNEILFNPLPGKADFVELYNRSTHIINLQEVYMGSLSLLGDIVNPVPLSNHPYHLSPGSYHVLTEDADGMLADYPNADTTKMMEGRSLPSMPDDKGSIAIANSSGRLIDAVAYEQSWHFPLLENKEGVSLERIDPMAPTQQASNWTSASSLCGYATPTRQNSQFHAYQSSQALVYIQPAAFTPDNDGINDLIGIHYTLQQTGYQMQVKIFDSNGRLVANPFSQAIPGEKGTLWWNGMPNQHTLPPGNYIVWVELVHTGGRVLHYKFVVALLRKG